MWKRFMEILLEKICFFEVKTHIGRQKHGKTKITLISQYLIDVKAELKVVIVFLTNAN